MVYTTENTLNKEFTTFTEKGLRFQKCFSSQSLIPADENQSEDRTLNKSLTNTIGFVEKRASCSSKRVLHHNAKCMCTRTNLVTMLLVFSHGTNHGSLY